MHVPGGRREEACDHDLTRNVAEDKTSDGLSWRVKVILTKTKKSQPTHCPNDYLLIFIFPLQVLPRRVDS